MTTIEQIKALDIQNLYLKNDMRHVAFKKGAESTKSAVLAILEADKPKGLDLEKLDRKLQEALAKETPESLKEWLDSKRSGSFSQDNGK